MYSKAINADHINPNLFDEVINNYREVKIATEHQLIRAQTRSEGVQLGLKLVTM